MNILIIEDEKPAAENLERLLLEYDHAIVIKDKLVTIEQSVNWLKSRQDEIDLIFMDIKLTDGLSFEIFDKVSIHKPLIFLTAFSEYALEAFHANGIDYLLKPLNQKMLNASMNKLERLRESLSLSKHKIQLEELGKTLIKLQKNYKTRFMVKVGEHIRSITTDKIALFYAEGRNVFMRTVEGREYIVDYRLEDLEDILDPEQFFRANRTYFINIQEIKDVLIYSKSRLRIILENKFEKEIIVSRDKVNLFKYWFDGQE